MADKPSVLSATERNIVLVALSILVKSQRRAEKAAAGAAIAKAYADEAAATEALQAKFRSLELSL